VQAAAGGPAGTVHAIPRRTTVTADGERVHAALDPTALGLAAGASVVFAVANNLLRGAASVVPVDAGGPVRLLVRLLGTPRWLLGSALALAALALHAVALARGGVILVQSVLASGLIVALGLEAVSERRRPGRRELGGAFVLVAGVVLVLAWGRPAGGRPIGLRVQAMTSVVLLLFAAVGLLYSSARRHPTRAAVVMAAAAGACFAVDAVFLKGLSNSLDDLDALPVLTCVAGFAVASFLGNLLVQRAYQRAPLRVALPAVTAADPLTAFAIGRFLLGETLRSGPAAITAVTVGLVGIAVGIVLTTTSAPPAGAAGS